MEKLYRKFGLRKSERNKPIQHFVIDTFKVFAVMVWMVGASIVTNAKNIPDENPAIIVSGKVTSLEDGQGLPGVNVLVKGTSIGTTTDANGDYTLEAPSPESVLIFSSIGYATEEIAVGVNTVINITMSPDIQSLTEIVVVGYGTQKKIDVTNSIATFKTEGLVERPLQRVDQALIGQMAGVRVKQTSGVPGKGFSVQVRGTGSIGGNTEPLYVIDGFPLEVTAPTTSGSPPTTNGTYTQGNPLDNLNPNDIESIQVLKDASAGAIYGSRAANGVVIITTKKGQSGKAKINFNYYTGWSEAVRKVDMLSAEEWMDWASEWIDYNWVNSGAGRTADQTSAQRIAILGTINKDLVKDDRWADPNHEGLKLIDWQDEMMRQAKVSSYQASASGGTDMVKYFVSGDYLDQEGILLGTGYKRYSTRANVELQANSKLKFGLNLAPSYGITNGGALADRKDGMTQLMLQMTPVTEADYGLKTGTKSVGKYFWGKTLTSPTEVMRNTLDLSKNFRTLGTVFAEYELIKDLRFRTSVNLDNSDVNTKSFQPSEVSATSTGFGATTGSAGGYNRQTFVNENTLSFNKTIGERHTLSLLIGQSYNTYKFSNWVVNGGTYASDNINVITTSNYNTSGSTSETKNVLLSYFGRLQYNFDNRYFITGSLRRDGSSKFGVDTMWGLFPSASLGWRISGENFMENVTAISDLKLRASWGKAGNNGTGSDDYAGVPTLSGANTSFGGTVAIGWAPNKISNPNLGWEEAETIDLGMDISFIQNRFNLTLDYYTKTNRNLLLDIPTSRITGFGSAKINLGEVENKGYEIELNTRNLVGDFQWNTSVNFSHNENMVKKLGLNNARLEYNGGFDESHSLIAVGQPMFVINTLKMNGILTQEDIDNNVPRLAGSAPGDPKYEDYTGDGTITLDDRQIVANPAPNFTWGITNTFKYKGFDLTVFVQGQQGGFIYSMFGRALGRVKQGYLDNPLGSYRDRWRSDSEPGNGTQHKGPSKITTVYKSTDWLYSSDYWRVRNITLGYNLNSLIKSKKIVSGARIYVTAENWFGHDKYKGGYNPEAVNNAGEDYGGFPLSRSVIFGLNLTF